MDCTKLFEHIAKRRDEYVDVWEQLVLIESPTSDKAGVDAASAYLAQLGRDIGLTVEVFPQERAGNLVCMTLNPNATAAPVVFSGHIDTVHPVGSFGTPAVRREGDCIYGPGVMDCKGGVVAALAAIHALKDMGYAARPVKLIAQTDEELNSTPSNKQTVRIILQEAKDAVAFLNCESTKGETLVLGRKGIVQFEFIVRGKPIHSSRCPEGISAICEAAHKIVELERMKDADGLTCNCGLISGGTAKNTVPEECRFTADIRFWTVRELDEARRTVMRVADTPYVGATCEVKQVALRPAMEQTAANRALFEQINRIYDKVGLPTATARTSLGGSDAAYASEAGIPTVDSIGVAGDFIHTKDEYAIISSLEAATKRLAAIAYYIE